MTLKKEASAWYENRFHFVFKNAGVLFNFKTGNLSAINDCLNSKLYIAGGCGFSIKEDVVAEEDMECLSKAGLTIEIPFSKMEIEEEEELREVAKGYLYPPEPGYPLSNEILEILQAIAGEDIELFEEKKGDLWFWNWNYKDPMGRYLVHHAAAAKTDHFLLHIINKWGKIDWIDSQGFTPLHYAAAHGSIDCIYLLLSHRPDLLEQPAQNGETPLFIAVQYGQRDAVQALLGQGANPNCRIVMEIGALVWAIKAKEEEIAIDLLSHPVIDSQCESRWGERAIYWAIESKSVRVLEKLVEVGVEINRFYSGQTPLHHAIAMGWLEGVEILLKVPHINLGLMTSDRESCVYLAKKYGQKEILHHLLEEATK